MIVRRERGDRYLTVVAGGAGEEASKEGEVDSSIS